MVLVIQLWVLPVASVGPGVESWTVEDKRGGPWSSWGDLHCVPELSLVFSPAVLNAEDARAYIRTCVCVHKQAHTLGGPISPLLGQ